jgi:hypothetical protein
MPTGRGVFGAKNIHTKGLTTKYTKGHHKEHKEK